MEKEAQKNKTNRNKLASLKREQKSKEERYQAGETTEDKRTNKVIDSEIISELSIGNRQREIKKEEQHTDQRILKRTIAF